MKNLWKVIISGIAIGIAFLMLGYIGIYYLSGENIFVKEISEVIREDVDNEDIKNVTILSVKVSGDLSYAKVYFTTNLLNLEFI